MSLFSDAAENIGTPYWWEQGAALPDLPSTLPDSAELLIVGAGYTGLSAAIAASDAGIKVVVVDAGIPGKGASTRNGGMFGPHPRLGFDTLANKFGQSVARDIFSEAQDAFDFTSGLIKKEDIACHYDECGRIQLAWTKAHFESQRKQVQQLKSIDYMDVELVEKDELQSEINSPCYFGGIRFPQHASVHPRQFHDGLIAAVLKRGVTVVQNCPIEHIEKKDTRFIATATSGNQLVAEKTIMATNGYTQGKFEWFARRVFPLPSFIIATEPLSSNLIKTLAPGRRMMVETRARHSYFRISPDGSRILFGGRASMTPVKPVTAAKRMRETMCQVWPELESVKLSHSWSGNTGYSFTHMPQVGTHEGLGYSMGYSGSGVVMAPYLGAKAAYQAIGDERGLTAFTESAIESRWFHQNGKPHFLKAANFWYKNVVDHLETRAANAGRRNNGS